MYQKIIDELKKLNPIMNFEKNDSPMGGSYVDVRYTASCPLMAILRLPEGWHFKNKCTITNGEKTIRLVPLP